MRVKLAVLALGAIGAVSPGSEAPAACGVDADRAMPSTALVSTFFTELVRTHEGLLPATAARMASTSPTS